jgi:hypothetical protein
VIALALFLSLLLNAALASVLFWILRSAKAMK